MKKYLNKKLNLIMILPDFDLNISQKNSIKTKIPISSQK
jgi:hypothetical protein